MSIQIAGILAGGLSSRMGHDKALLSVGGIPMLERVARTALEICPTLMILGREHPPLTWPRDLAAHFLPDPPALGLTPGPMAALIAALDRTHQPLLLLACDMPLLTTATIRPLIAAHANAHANALSTLATLATTTKENGILRAEPALAIYTPNILPTLRDLIKNSHGSFQPLLSNPNVHQWPVPNIHRHELLNVNDKQSLAIADRHLSTTSPAVG